MLLNAMPVLPLASPARSKALSAMKSLGVADVLYEWRLGVTNLSYLATVTTAYAKWAGTAAGVECRRCELARVISPE